MYNLCVCATLMPDGSMEMTAAIHNLRYKPQTSSFEAVTSHIRRQSKKMTSRHVCGGGGSSTTDAAGLNMAEQ